MNKSIVYQPIPYQNKNVSVNLYQYKYKYPTCVHTAQQISGKRENEISGLRRVECGNRCECGECCAVVLAG